LKASHSAIGSLMTEHRLIERVIADIERQLGRLEGTDEADPGRIEVLVDFLQTYADRCHHGKEEDILFRELEARSLKPEHAAMMQELIEGHAFARATTRALIAASRAYAGGDMAMSGEIRRRLRDLAAFYPGHIRLEDRSFFKPAIEYFTVEERESMAERFAEFDRTLIHEKYAAVAERLEAWPVTTG
jgi:hemerythrin-like domain-containing protein